jgi:DNA-binding winged helix-turn-helix (wHTH) protein
MSVPVTARSTLGARGQGIAEAKPRSRSVSFGHFQVDLLREELFKNGLRVHVPSKVYQVLLALLERPGEMVTRDDLRARLWPGGTFVNYDANVNTSVNKLRLALGDSPDQPRYVETIPRQGYCFVGNVERRNELTKSADGSEADMEASTTRSQVRAASVGTTVKFLTSRLPGFFASGWAAAILLCGVLIGIGIVLFTHRPL